MSWHREVFEEMENIKLARLKNELTRLRSMYLRESDKIERDKIDVKVKYILKELEKIEKDKR